MHIESLPPRRMFSVTVIEGYPGFYEVYGDGDANVIDIEVSQQQGSFTLDGNTYTDVNYIAVLGGGGDDTISVQSVDGPGFIGVGISGQEGDDTLSLNSDGAIWGGAGDDVIVLLDSFYGEAYGDGGNDTITIGGETVGGQIEGGDGDDVIDASAGHYGLYFYAGGGNDTIFGTAYDDAFYGGSGTDEVHGGAGDDDIYDSEYVYGDDGYDALRGTYTFAQDVEEFL
jgi:Ca2+-binding RTX toxin-like protein